MIPAEGITDLAPELLKNNKMRLFHAEHYKKYDWYDLRIFCHKQARYGIPTVELVDYLTDRIAGRSVIEIGAGSGDLGHHLGIKMTDSWQQAEENVSITYKLMQQPTITYPSDVEKIDALDAVILYEPKVVIASWITTYSPNMEKFNSNPYGVKEAKILDLVDTLIIVGNLDIHGDKPIRQIEHSVIKAPWILSRAKKQENNCIFIWDKKNG